MNAASMKARVLELVQVIGVSLLAGCGGGGGGDLGNTDGSGADANRPPPVASTRHPFQLRHAISVVEYADCPKGLEKVGVLPIAFAGAGVFAACIEADTVVTVDGQRFDAASIPDGSVAIINGLRTVTNDGRRTSVATAIDLQRTVVGTIESVDWAHARFSVLGQQIYVSDITRISGAGTTNALEIGTRVAVSGFFSPTGDVVATTITDDTRGQGFLLRGIVHFDEFGVLSVGRLIIGSVHDDVFENFPEDWSGPGQTGPVANGHPVLVLADTPPFDGALTPYAVRYIGGDLGEGSGAILRYFEGLISNRPSPSVLEVEGHRVDCELYDCSDVREAPIGTLVGVIRSAGAGDPRNQVAWLPPASNRMYVYGPVGHVDAQNGSLNILGFPIQALPATSIIDAYERRSRLDDIDIDDAVFVVGGPVKDLLVAGYIDPAPDVSEPIPFLIGTRVAQYADPEIHVLGRTIHTDSTTVVFEDCVGRRDQRWLFAVSSSIAQVRMEVSQGSGGEIFATRVDVDTGVCP